MLFHASPPTERIPPCTAFQLCPIHKHGFVVCFSLFFQQLHILVKQVLHSFYTSSRAKPDKRRMVWCFLPLQQPFEIDSVLTGFLQLPTGIDPALIPVHHYLEHHSRIDLRFSPAGRIGAIQFPVVQFLKLGACQSDGCVLRQQIFFIQCNYQLTVALNYCKLVLL